MKKYFSMLVAVCMLFTMGTLPAKAADSDVEKVLTKVKQAFQIDDTGLKFTYDESKDDGIGEYLFEWTNQKQNNSIRVETDLYGHILYYMNNLDDEEESGNIPKISKSEAINIAYENIQRICPEMISQISKDYVRVSSGYNVQFDRIVNGILVRDNSVSVRIDDMTGRLDKYDADSWVWNVEVPQKQTIIPKETIATYFTKNMPLELVYRSFYKEDTEKYDVKLVYEVKSNDKESYINAITGKTVLIENTYGCTAGGSANTVTEDSKAELSEAELTEITTHNNFITSDKALSVLKSMTNLDFDSSATISSYDVNSQESRYSDQMNYMLSLDFQRNGKNYSAYATFDVKSGTLKRFYNFEHTTTKNIKVNYETAKAAANAFASSYDAEHYKQCQFDTEYNKAENDSKYVQMRDYYFTYNRYVNGVKFLGNSITVAINPETGKVSEFYDNWDNDITFESANNIINVEKAVENHLNYFNQNYQYAAVTKNDAGNYIMGNFFNSANEKISTMPIYSYQNDAFVDAKTGAVVNYAMKPYEKEEGYLNLEGLYPQLEGHYCQNIALKLFDMGIAPEKKDFKPDDVISKKQFEKLADHLQNWYDASSSSEMESADAELLTRMDAVKIIINNLGYEKIAQKSSIFNCTFSDKAAIGEKNYGYAAIAKGLNICQGSGNNFMPNKTLTYADALIMIYNALNA